MRNNWTNRIELAWCTAPCLGQFPPLHSWGAARHARKTSLADAVQNSSQNQTALHRVQPQAYVPHQAIHSRHYKLKPSPLIWGGLLDILWPKWSKPIVGPCTYRTSILIREDNFAPPLLDPGHPSPLCPVRFFLTPHRWWGGDGARY